MMKEGIRQGLVHEDLEDDAANGLDALIAAASNLGHLRAEKSSAAEANNPASDRALQNYVVEHGYKLISSQNGILMFRKFSGDQTSAAQSAQSPQKLQIQLVYNAGDQFHEGSKVPTTSAP